MQLPGICISRKYNDNTTQLYPLQTILSLALRGEAAAAAVKTADCYVSISEALALRTKARYLSMSV